MSGKDDDGARRNVVDFFDEDRPFRLKRPDHLHIVHDGMPDVDRSAMTLERIFNRPDGAAHSRAETPWRNEQDVEAGEAGSFALGSSCRRGGKSLQH